VRVRIPLALSLASLLCCLPAAPCLADMSSARETIVRCLGVIDHADPKGLEAIKPLCPDLERALSDSGLAEQLGAEWQKGLDRTQLDNLQWLMQRYASREQSTGPDAGSLADIVHQLRVVQTKPSWWDRFLAWLRHLLEPTQNAAPSWLERLLTALSRAPQWLWTAIRYIGTVVIVLMIAVMVWREVRIAREASRRAQPRERGQALALGQRKAAVSLADLDAAPLTDRPVLLLRLLVQSLLASGRLSNDRSLTHGELIARGRFDDDEQQRRFARVSRLAERRIYGSLSPEAGQAGHPELDQAVADGRQLYAQLSGAQRSAP
jgi:hypothetical protein